MADALRYAQTLGTLCEVATSSPMAHMPPVRELADVGGVAMSCSGGRINDTLGGTDLQWTVRAGSGRGAESSLALGQNVMEVGWLSVRLEE